MVARKPQAPYSALAQAYLRLGEAQDRLGARAAAVAAYRSAAAATPADDPHGVREHAAELMRRSAEQPHRRRVSPLARRLAAVSNRTICREPRRRSSNRSRSTSTIRSRTTASAASLEARHDDGGALAHFEMAIRNARACPAPILATAYLEAARLYERAGRRDEAIGAYRIVTTLFGGAQETRDAAARALARLDQTLIAARSRAWTTRIARVYSRSRAAAAHAGCAHF